MKPLNSSSIGQASMVEYRERLIKLGYQRTYHDKDMEVWEGPKSQTKIERKSLWFDINVYPKEVEVDEL